MYGSAGATYTAMEEIEKFLDSMGVSRPEEMIGKFVAAYERGQRLVGLSALPESYKQRTRDDKFIDGVCASDT
ncbi:hypothetical protein HYX14_04210 [Candidatus Woesearchaeota archaeon]|nr:hypothetical protein [Candidatus Woesearchaeota archaeon]